MGAVNRICCSEEAQGRTQTLPVPRKEEQILKISSDESEPTKDGTAALI